jgi:phospholipase C
MWEKLEMREIRHRSPEPPGERPRPDLPPGTDLVPQIKHVIVLVMENHSYDNYLGALSGRGDGFGPGDAAGLHRLGSVVQEKNDPIQSWRASHIQYGRGDNGGFPKSVPGYDPSVPMGYFTEQDLPFYYGLAKTFPLADRWFCSCLGPTFPNRRFLIAGTAHGLIDDLPFDLVDFPPAGTIFDSLTRHGIHWIDYHNVRPAKIILKRLLGQGGLIAMRRLASFKRWIPALADAVSGNKSFTADLYPLGFAGCMRHLRTLQRFFADVDAGTLPSFSIIDPDYELFSEENPQDIQRGEAFAAEVIKRVMHGPAWSSTLLIWMYDEHGGYYDHVPPPSAVVPDDVPPRNLVLSAPLWVQKILRRLFNTDFEKIEDLDAGARSYDRLGFRVPAVIVSPYARTSFVTSVVHDHTSVLKLIEEKWNLPTLTSRDAAATAPWEALALDAPPAFLSPPDLPESAIRWNPNDLVLASLGGAGFLDREFRGGVRFEALVGYRLAALD